MSQRECAGFNWPPLSIPAEEPVSSSPVAVSRAGPHIAAKSCSRCCTFDPSARVIDIADSGLPVASLTTGVFHPASMVKSFRLEPCRVSPIARNACPPPDPSLACGVGQPAIHTCRPSSALIGTFRHSAQSLWSRVMGVGHPVKSVSDVRRTDARRRERDRPEGVTQGFQVSVYKVDPRACVLTRNLLSNDCWRSALRDEVVEGWPQMPLVIKPSSFACRAERLAGARACPNSSIVSPPSES